MEPLPLDIIVTQWLNQWITGHPDLIPFVVFAAEGLGVLTIIGVVLFLFQHTHAHIGPTNVAVVFSSAACAYLLSLGIKVLVERPRPGLVLETVQELSPYVNAMWSFPSGHATLFTALAVSIFFFHRRLGVVLILIAVCISIARVLSGIHWFTDICAGVLLGAIVAWVIYATIQRFGFFSKRAMRT